jgi:hypothetical protein
VASGEPPRELVQLDHDANATVFGGAGREFCCGKVLQGETGGVEKRAVRPGRMVDIAVQPARSCVLALARSSGLMPVIDDHRRISRRGNLVLLLARRIGAHRVMSTPGPSQSRRTTGILAGVVVTIDVSGSGCCLKRP